MSATKPEGTSTERERQAATPDPIPESLLLEMRAAAPEMADALRPFAKWAQTSTWHQTVATVQADDCRRALEVLRKAGIAITLGAALLAPAVLRAAPAPGASKLPRAHVRPISSITVKVVPDVDFERREAQLRGSGATWAGPTQTLWLVTSLDIDSCVAWVPMRQAGASEVLAFAACRKAIDRTVDAAHAAAEAEKGAE